MRLPKSIVMTVFGSCLALTLPGAVANELVGATGSTACKNGLNIHQPDDPTIQYRPSGLTIGNYNQTVWVMDNHVGPTDLNKSLVSSGGDFIYFDDGYIDFCGYDWHTSNSPGTRGFAKCDVLIGSACDTHHIYMTTAYTETVDTGARRKLICHETVHSIGITHNEHTSPDLASCMITPPNTGINGFSNHEINDMIDFVW